MPIQTVLLENCMESESLEFGNTQQDILPTVSNSFNTLAPFDDNFGKLWAVSYEPWGNHLSAANLMGRMSHDYLYKHQFLAPNLKSALEYCK